MLTRLYIDNFRCFVNFEYRADHKNLILGRNGSGKTSFLHALLSIRQLVIMGKPADELFSLNQRTRWLDLPDQTYEIEATVDSGDYVYRVVVAPGGDPVRAEVSLETLLCDEKPIFEFKAGEVQLYNDNFDPEAKYPFDPSRSALATIVPRKDNLTLIRFKRWLAGLYCFRLNPFVMDLRAEGDNLYPNVNLSNIAAWYRHLLQAQPAENTVLIESLRVALDDFAFLKLEPAGENVRLLVAEFRHAAGRSIRVGFSELSDGQRCLICLYVILHFVLTQRSTVIIDEPENFISLPEIQPWLTAVADLVEEGRGQILLISHHPELINQWAPGSGVEFVRDATGSIRIERFQGDPGSSLSPAELVARGWERG